MTVDYKIILEWLTLTVHWFLGKQSLLCISVTDTVFIATWLYSNVC